MENIKQSELLHFSKLKTRAKVLELDPAKRADLVENAMSFLYRAKTKEEREELLSLIQTILADDPEIAQNFTTVAYTVCNRHLTITFVNDVFLERSGVLPDAVIGNSLYYSRENVVNYEGTQIEQLYSMVMETRLLADALVRYRNIHLGFDGWFVLVVIPLDEGGIGVLSKFTRNRGDVLDTDIDPNAPDAPRVITL
jgi:hypothetical protein